MTFAKFVIVKFDSEAWGIAHVVPIGSLATLSLFVTLLLYDGDPSKLMGGTT